MMPSPMTPTVPFCFAAFISKILAVQSIRGATRAVTMPIRRVQ
jgi:hypothetical protein